MFLICREWIPPIAQAFGREAGMPHNLALHETGIVAMHKTIALLDAAPWHHRVMIRALEIGASLFCRAYCYWDRTATVGSACAVFEEFPLLARPLLETYRSLAGMAWFEHPLVQKHFALDPLAMMPQPQPAKRLFTQAA